MENALKKFYDNCKIFHLMSLSLTAIVFAFAFFFFSSLRTVVQENSIFENKFQQNTPLYPPAGPQKIQRTLNSANVPLLNSRRNDNSSNPPLNRVYEALFNRNYTEITLAEQAQQVCVSKAFFHYYLQHVIPARAGPSVC